MSVVTDVTCILLVADFGLMVESYVGWYFCPLGFGVLSSWLSVVPDGPLVRLALGRVILVHSPAGLSFCPLGFRSCPIVLVAYPLFLYS